MTIEILMFELGNFLESTYPYYLPKLILVAFFSIFQLNL